MDLHGKVSEQLHLDLGAAPLEAVWPEDQSFVRALKFNFCKKLDQARAHANKKKQQYHTVYFFVFFFAGGGVDIIRVVVCVDIACLLLSFLFVDVMVEDLEMLFI